MEIVKIFFINCQSLKIRNQLMKSELCNGSATTISTIIHNMTELDIVYTNYRSVPTTGKNFSHSWC